MPFWILLVGMLLLPLAGQWSAVVNGWAWLTGDPSVYAVGPGTEEWSQRLVFLVAFVAVAAFVWGTDRWLSLIVGFAGLQTFVMGPKIVSAYFVLGIAVMIVLRRAPSALRAHAVTLAAASGLTQALLVLAQTWHGLAGVGSFGTSGPAACHIAACGLLLPEEIGGKSPMLRLGLVMLALGVIGAAVTLTGSRAGLAAFLVGLGVRYVPSQGLALVGLALVAVIAVSVVWRAPAIATDSISARVNLHRLTMQGWARSAPTILVGHGLGSFSQDAEAMQRDHLRALGESPATPRFLYAAHFDLLQWLYETGITGSLLLSGWFLTWRRRLAAPPYAPAYAVFAVMSLAWFPFHDLRTGFLAAGLAGLGTGTPCRS